MNQIISILGLGLMAFVLFLSTLQPGIPERRVVENLKPWPPEIGKPYPDLALIDQDGRHFRLSDYRGKVILLQPVGMNSPRTQALAGAALKGAYGKIPLDQKAQALSLAVPEYAGGLNFPHPDVIFLQILFYGMDMRQPSLQDAQKWAQHFGFSVAENEIVAISPHDLRSMATYTIIPGVQLVDRNGILQADSTGREPKDDLNTTLLPLLPIAIESKKR